MRVLSEQKLVDEVRTRCDRVTKRLWIASPFIGDWKSIRQVLGRNWIDNEDIEVRLLTDHLNINGTAFKTIKYFQKRGDIKDLKGLHAKIYILDDNAIVTSANLTGAAFFKRYEAGVLLTDSFAKSVIDLYGDWWNNKAVDFSADFKPRISKGRSKEVGRETWGTSLPKLWEEPDDPGDPYAGRVSEFCDYSRFLRCYKEFAETYSRMQRLWPKSPQYFETDAFLNYLFHEARRKPSNKYRRQKPRQLDRIARENEIIKYAAMFRNWISSAETRGKEGPQIRLDSSRIIKVKLNQDRIAEINRNDVEEVVQCLNCMGSNALNKTRFLNRANNDLKSIRNAWKTLLHGRGPLEVRMSKCHRTLKWFGKSSIQELIGFYYPEQYPLRNSNSNAGLRFFGYNVSVH